MGDLKTLLESALEHGSHAWRNAEEELGNLSWEGWPPQVPHSESGTLTYHLAAMIDKVYRAWNLVTEEDGEAGR